MNTENFAYWLHGFDEISNGQVPNQVQWEIIKDHLKLAIEFKQFRMSGDISIC